MGNDDFQKFTSVPTRPAPTIPNLNPPATIRDMSTGREKPIPSAPTSKVKKL